MSYTLASQQQAMLAALWAPRSQDALTHVAHCLGNTAASAARGLQAYRSHGRELAVRALAGAYPVVAQLLGDDNFDALAKALWMSTPPTVGDMACWGDGFATFLADQHELMAEDPYMPDVARVEWALHSAATAADAEVDAASFALLAEHDPADLSLQLSPGWACVASPYPVVSVVNAHVVADPSLVVAGQRLREGVAETALIWRQAFKPCVRLAQPHEGAFLAALAAGHTLALALDHAPDFDFGAWLAPAAQSGLLVAVHAR
jgi:hypothetical protein